uniref:Saposin B-type domain-containing protein n=1 Tax=Pygocentrus nattereri TaxID=42514 RepID=A0AAR2LWM9_PYGNA
MLRNILITFLLIDSGCAMHLEYLKVESDEEPLHESLAADQAEDMPMPGAVFPGKCWACKWAMGKLKQSLSSDASVGMIKEKLRGVCNSIGFLKSICRGIVNRYLDVLTEELSTTDDPATICANIGICRRVTKKPLTKVHYTSNYSLFVSFTRD